MQGSNEKTERPMKIGEGGGGGGGGNKHGVGAERKQVPGAADYESPEPPDTPPIIKHGVGAQRKNDPHSGGEESQLVSPEPADPPEDKHGADAERLDTA